MNNTINTVRKEQNEHSFKVVHLAVLSWHHCAELCCREEAYSRPQEL